MYLAYSYQLVYMKNCFFTFYRPQEPQRPQKNHEKILVTLHKNFYKCYSFYTLRNYVQLQ